MSADSQPFPQQNWSSRFAFLMAAIGSAVGLGNIWKFPYMAGANGGGAFVLVYLFCIAFIAIPILTAEIALGRMGKNSPPHSVKKVAARYGRNPRWSLIGWLGILAAYLVGTYYCVIAGWTISYTFKSGTGVFSGKDADAIAEEFSALLASPLLMIFWQAVFLVICAAILGQNLKDGVERWVKILMPALFILLLVMVAYSAVEGNMLEGLKYLFVFDIGSINGHVVLMAIGHAFFSIGVAMGVMLGFGAYLGSDINIGNSALIISLSDTAVALIAGIAIFPIVFAYGLDPAQGPGLVFVSLPIAFGQMPGGAIFGTLFFLLLFFAALTSVVTVCEPMVTWLQESAGMSRPRSAACLCVSLFVVGLGTVFSFNLWADWYPLAFIDRFSKSSFFEVLDYITLHYIMLLGGLLLALFAGWRIPTRVLQIESGISQAWLFNSFVWLLRIVAPLAILAIFISNLLSK